MDQCTSGLAQRANKIAHVFSIVSGGKYFQKDGERRGYEPEVFSRIFWEQTKAEEEEERFVKSNTYLGAIEYIIGVI